MSATEEALARIRRLTESLPLATSAYDLYGGFSELARSDFEIPGKLWLNTFELAAIAKWVYLNSHSRKPHAVDWPPVLNAYKYLWKATEEASDYPTTPSVIASFMLRFVYQQLIWNITPAKMQANFLRARGVFGGASEYSITLRRRFEEASGVAFEDFLKAAHVLYGLFSQLGSSIADYQLREAMLRQFSAVTVDGTLRALSATRAGFRKYYEGKAAAQHAAGVVYEFNPLLRYPILHREDRYWCVFPELINYVATRGLYFYIADLAGQSFNAAFANAFESYVAGIIRHAYGERSVVTEDEERAAGWTGKTNDVSVVVQNSALLLECKNSGLFSVAKRSADPLDLTADIRKNLANAQKRKGLFQLYDKVQSIRSAKLPQPLQQKYASVEKYYPVLLLHDEIWFANRPETMKNLIDQELSAFGISGFEYQIWHVEELELLLKAVPNDQLGAVLDEKFNDPRYRWLDLTSYLSGRFGYSDLNIRLFLPHGESKALAILRTLADTGA